MAQRRWKGKVLAHPVVLFTAAGLLIGGTFSSILRTAPQPRPAQAPPAREPVVVSTLPPAGLPAPTAGPPAPAKPSAERPPSKSESAAPVPPVVPFAPPPAAVLGPPAPVRGPEWKKAPLPVVSPEVLRAMLNPRAVRRARHLRRLGIPAEALLAPPPGDAHAAGAHREAGRPAHPKPAVPRRTVVAAASGVAPGLAAPAPVAAGSTTLAPAETAKGAQPEAAGKSPTSGPDAEAGGAGDRKPAGESPAAAETAGKGAAGTEAATVSSRGPIWIRALLDRSRSEYRVGEWVVVRFLASQPVHLRVYRVDAAGHVTRVFSTYGREDRGSPARTFSMMVKAGEPRPGAEGIVAIGSARPLTRDELLSCLRAALGESPAPAGAAIAPNADDPGGAAATLPAPNALQSVIDAVANATDTPETAPAPLDRASWSVAVGRFVSSDRKLSAAGGARTEKRAPEGS